MVRDNFDLNEFEAYMKCYWPWLDSAFLETLSVTQHQKFVLIISMYFRRNINRISLRIETCKLIWSVKSCYFTKSRDCIHKIL